MRFQTGDVGLGDIEGATGPEDRDIGFRHGKLQVRGAAYLNRIGTARPCRRGADRAAYLSHGFAHRIEKGVAGVLH